MIRNRACQHLDGVSTTDTPIVTGRTQRLDRTDSGRVLIQLLGDVLVFGISVAMYTRVELSRISSA